MFKSCIALFFPLVFLLVFTSIIQAQVVVNEFSSASSDDWIELYAFEDTDLSQWVIRDTTSIVYTIEDEVVAGPSSSEFLVLDVGNRLNKAGDVIKLLKSDGSTLVDQLSYGDQGGVCAPEMNQAAGRYPDANSTIERFAESSRNMSNNASVLNPCPTPTPLPTSTSTPTPKSTSTPKPTATQKPTSTSIPTKTPTPTLKLTEKERNLSREDNGGELANKSRQEDSDSGILGIEEETLNEEKVSVEKEKKLPITSLIFIIAGVGFMGYSAFVFLRGKNRDII